MNLINRLKKLGLSDKEAHVYHTLIQQGPSPVRTIAQAANVNRGTTYDILKALMAMGLVTYYHKEKNQYFVAEEPNSLNNLIKQREEQLQQIKHETKDLIPLLHSMYDQAQGKPLVKFYEGYAGAAFILHDVLSVTARVDVKEYYAFSSGVTAFAGSMYKEFPDYTKERIKSEIAVKVIAIGDRGESIPELAQRKYLKKTLSESSPAYILIYGSKVAYIALDSAKVPFGLIVEDSAINIAQKIIFEQLWELL